MAQKAPDKTELADQRDLVLAAAKTLIIGAPPDAEEASLPEMGAVSYTHLTLPTTCSV